MIFHTSRLWPGSLALAGTLLFATGASSAEAQGLFRGQSGSICEQAQEAGIEPLRRTLVYVDRLSLSLAPDEQEWFGALNQVLQQTMTTAEPLEMVVLDSAKGTAKSHGAPLCYPVIEERYHDRFASSGISGLLTNDLIDQLPELQKDVVTQMQDLIGPGYMDAPESRSQRSAESVEERHLLRALQADAARFDSDVPTRIILYSDMIENSDVAKLEAVMTSTKEEQVALADAARESLPRLDFHGAMVYGFGTGAVLNDPSAVDALSGFMQQVIYLANGYPVEITRELAVGSVRPERATSYDMVVALEDRKIQGRMRLMSDANGRLTDSFLDLGVGNRSAHFDSGRLVCSQDAQCQLEGQLATALLFEDPEKVFLEGPRDALQGHVGFRNDRLADSDNPALVSLKASARP